MPMHVIVRARVRGRVNARLRVDAHPGEFPRPCRAVLCMLKLLAGAAGPPGSCEPPG